MSTIDPSLQDPPGARGPGARRRRRRLPIVALAVVVVVVVAAALWADHEAGGYYAYQPGTAPQLTTSPACRLDTSTGDLRLPGNQPCARLLVPADRAHPLDGNLLMVDVLVGKATPMEWVEDQLGVLNTFHRGSQLIPAPNVLGTTPASELACQDAQEMASATTTAPIVALDHLGYRVGMTDLGAQVELVQPGSAAAAAGVRCNDLVTAVDGRKVTTAAALGALIQAHRPGSTIEVTVSRAGTDGRSTTHVLRAKLHAEPTSESGYSPTAGFLGVATFTQITYKLPFDVGIDVGDIGGPSAGLALTLGVLDALSNGHLTGGHTVAVTGTISPNGDVGDVGGVAQKTVAVERAGATLFLVPPQELGAARSEANGRMRIQAVSTLAQALADLKAIGGQVPAAGHT